MKNNSSPVNYQKKTFSQEPHSVSDSKISSFSSDSCSIEEHIPDIMVKLRVYEKIMNWALHKESESNNPSSESPCVPPSPGSKENVARHQMMVYSNTAGVSTKGKSEECPCLASSTASPIAGQKGCKRKTKPKNESSDSEVILPRRVHTRGQVKRGQTGSNEEEMLNSSKFLHYFMHIWNDFSEAKMKSVAYFDPLWFNLYANEKRRDDVLKWIKEKDIMSKNYVLVPIVLWSHWSLLIFCHLGESPQSKTSTPCMLLLDSLHRIGPTRLEPLIRRLLSDLYAKTGRLLKKIPLLIPKVPQQKKGEECGYYVLYYINLFLKNAPIRFSCSKGYPYFMKEDWFSVEEVESFYKWLDDIPIVSSYYEEEDSFSMDSSDCAELIETPFEEDNNS